MHDPLAVRENAVGAEMNEHSKPHVFKVLDVLMNYHNHTSEEFFIFYHI